MPCFKKVDRSARFTPVVLDEQLIPDQFRACAGPVAAAQPVSQRRNRRVGLRDLAAGDRAPAVGQQDDFEHDARLANAKGAKITV